MWCEQARQLQDDMVEHAVIYCIQTSIPMCAGKKSTYILRLSLMYGACVEFEFRAIHCTCTNKQKQAGWGETHQRGARETKESEMGYGN